MTHTLTTAQYCPNYKMMFEAQMPKDNISTTLSPNLKSFEEKFI